MKKYSETDLKVFHYLLMGGNRTIENIHRHTGISCASIKKKLIRFMKNFHVVKASNAEDMVSYYMTREGKREVAAQELKSDTLSDKDIS
jgi:hypothetical protein